MELVKNKPRDPEQLLSASSPGTLGAAAAVPQDKSISPLPSSPTDHCPATHPGSSGSAAAGIQGQSLSGPGLGSTQGPKPPPASRTPPAQSPQQSHRTMPSLLGLWGPEEDISIPVKPAGTEPPRAAPVAAKIVVLQPLPASRPSQEHYPSPAGKIPAGCPAAGTTKPQGSSPRPAWH